MKPRQPRRPKRTKQAGILSQGTRSCKEFISDFFFCLKQLDATFSLVFLYQEYQVQTCFSWVFFGFGYKWHGIFITWVPRQVSGQLPPSPTTVEVVAASQLALFRKSGVAASSGVSVRGCSVWWTDMFECCFKFWRCEVASYTGFCHGNLCF